LGAVGLGPHSHPESGRTGANTGYTAREPVGLFLFTAAEVAAALELRRIAADIVTLHREHAAPADSPERVFAAT
jgi:hypothetical protein